MKYKMNDLEREIALVETDAINEEQTNADRIYANFDQELSSVLAKLSQYDINEYATGDYDDIIRLNGIKEIIKRYSNKRDEIKPYCNEGSLYSGHLKTEETDCYIMDNASLHTKFVKVDGEEILLLNADDREYSDYIRWWRYPNESRFVQFSRNITMYNRKVLNVDIILDKKNKLLANISDGYLRKALIRNKDKTGVQSIIQTIQQKQDYIRSLPKDKSFIVQGCAGSGKTMVLLHRLRYLLYNRDINNKEYLFLVPSNKFIEFISDSLSDFNISKNNILSYQNYYQNCLDKSQQNKYNDASELVFESKYLEKVYSKAFMQEVYQKLFTSFSKQLSELIDFSEEKLNNLLETEQTTLEKEIIEVKKNAVGLSNDIIKNIKEFTEIKIDNSYDAIEDLIIEIQNTYLQKKDEYEKNINNNIEIVVLPEDERFLKNERLSNLKESIKQENLLLEKASIFTRLSHKNKLNKLKAQYDLIYLEVEKEIIEQEKKVREKEARELQYVYSGVSLSDVEGILSALKNILLQSTNEIFNIKKSLDDLEKHLASKYEKIIKNLNILIDISSDLINIENDFVKNLSPSCKYFAEIVKVGVELINAFQKQTTEKESNYLKSNLKLFNQRTNDQLYAYLYMVLFSFCKKQIYNEFNIKLCDAYKHYWYLALYCNYLVKPMKMNIAKYIFIDEAQDLSIAELELIEKINTNISAPIMNLFGDTYQMITTHGILNWEQIRTISEKYTLDENFRNTNQVVDYCNKSLMMNMVKIGVDMEEVAEYRNLLDARMSSNTIANNAIFIVKDDYAVTDLTHLLATTNIRNYEIYTVKAVKGLEFKEVFVFDTDMSVNEKYIAYTRALIKLNVIKLLPKGNIRKKDLIIQGDELEEM